MLFNFSEKDYFPYFGSDVNAFLAVLDRSCHPKCKSNIINPDSTETETSCQQVKWPEVCLESHDKDFL